MIELSPFQIRNAFIDIVGEDVYQVWMNMMRWLVPSGRTERLSVFVAGLLQYADYKRRDLNIGTNNVVVQAIKELNYDPPEPELFVHVIELLFKDAGVSYKRTNRHGEKYCIAEQAKNEFWRWYCMPWE